MAHARASLGPILQLGNGNTLWQLAEAETIANISAANYLNLSAGRFLANDVILVIGSNGIAWRKVTSDDGTTVVIAAFTA